MNYTLIQNFTFSISLGEKIIIKVALLHSGIEMELAQT
jgi:hypothetical protein